MAVVNRDLASSSQCEVYNKSLGAVATGVTNTIALIPYSAQVVSGALRAYGLSGSPVYSVNILRQVGAAVTLVGLGATITATDGAATAFQGISFVGGATFFLQPGDVLMVNSGAANTAVTGLELCVVLKRLQDVVSFFNVQP